MPSPLSNGNVRYILIFTALSGLSSGVWGFMTLSGYLLQLTGKNSLVGRAEGIQGLAQALLALPSGFLADRVGRQQVIRLSSLVLMLSVVAINVALFTASNIEYALMTFSLGLFGAYSGIANAPIEALFADSLSTQDRPRYLTYKYVLRVFAAGAGPMTAMFLYLFIGNEWHLTQLRTVMHVGTFMALLPAVMLFLLRDDATLGMESEGILHHNDDSMEAQVAGDQEAENRDVEYYAEDHDASDMITRSPMLEQGSPMLINRSQLPPTALANPRAKYVPYICAFADVVFGLASGMTIKFFPLFFKVEVGLSPIAVNGIYCITPFLMSASSLIAQRISVNFGRVQTILTSKFVGISLLYAMWLMGVGHDKQSGDVPLWKNLWVIVPVFVARTVLMNSCSPLQKSILMEYVPKESRGKWNAFDSVTAFGWSGSAVLGGFLADKYGYGATFLVTAAAQSVGWLAIAMMLPIVERNPGRGVVFIPANQIKRTVVTHTNDLDEPLLQEDDEE